MNMQLCCHHRASCSISDQLAPWCAAVLWKGWAASFEALQEMDIQDQQPAGGDCRADLWCVRWWTRLSLERREHQSVTLCPTEKKKKRRSRKRGCRWWCLRVFHRWGRWTELRREGENKGLQDRCWMDKEIDQLTNEKATFAAYNAFQIDGWHRRTEPPKVLKGKWKCKYD